MTTPQTILFDIHRKINELIKLFQPSNEEDGEDQTFIENIESIKESMGFIEGSIERFHDKLSDLSNTTDLNKIKEAHDSIVDRLEKFEENYKRFEVMFNEFKGVVSMTRSNLKSKDTSS